MARYLPVAAALLALPHLLMIAAARNQPAPRVPQDRWVPLSQREACRAVHPSEMPVRARQAKLDGIGWRD